MRMCRELLRDRDGKDGDVGDQQRQCDDRNHDAPSALRGEKGNNDRQRGHHRGALEQYVKADPVRPEVRALLFAAGGSAHHGPEHKQHDNGAPSTVNTASAQFTHNRRRLLR
jgi:hypothetical protein